MQGRATASLPRHMLNSDRCDTNRQNLSEDYLGGTQPSLFPLRSVSYAGHVELRRAGCLGHLLDFQLKLVDEAFRLRGSAKRRFGATTAG